MIHNFSDFCNLLYECGFSMGGGNAKGIFAVIPFGCKDQENGLIQSHIGNPEMDPWEWRMRVLEERNDIAYSKFFFQTGGYITKEWYPYFYAVRRSGKTFQEIYENGIISREEKHIYEIISSGKIAIDEIKKIGGYHRENKSKFERAIVNLQMRMFITLCGRSQKRNKYGEDYGWNSTVFTTVENFWSERGCLIPDFDAVKSYDKIKTQILKLNPEAEQKQIDKFIRG